MALRYLVPALAVAGRAAASCSGTTTITNTADASALATCLTYSGSIAIATSASGDIALDGVRRITGSLEAKSIKNLGGLSADSLSQIDDTFYLEDLTTLTSLNFPALASLDTLDWSGLPNLGGLSFTTGLSQAQDVSIQNTGLITLDGINLADVKEIVITNNFFLSEISMQLGSISNGATFEANGRNLKVELSNLIWAYNMTMRNCSSVDIDSLSSVNGSLGFYDNYFGSLSAPNLTSVGSQLTFYQNNDMTSLSMPELKTVGGGFYIADNSQYKKIDDFPRLTDVFGAIDCYGVFTEISLPKLKLVKGAFNVQSTGNIQSDCDHFKSIAGPNKDIRGNFNCKPKISKPNSGGIPSTGTGSGSSSSSSSFASPIHISGATGVLGVVAAIFGML